MFNVKGRRDMEIYGADNYMRNVQSKWDMEVYSAHNLHAQCAGDYENASADFKYW